jgi:hypothetical protein
MVHNERGTMEQVVQCMPLVAPAQRSPVELRRVTRLSGAELDEATKLLTAAFDASPMLCGAFPHAETRRKVMQFLFTAVLEDALQFGRIEIARNGHMAGVLIWYPPGLYPLSIARTLRELPHYLRMVTAAPLGIAKLLWAQIKLNAIRPRTPHCHGYFLAGRPGEQVGSILCKRLLAVADELGQPIYLETQEGRTVNLYARLGFKMLQNGMESWPGGPLTWTMWREAPPRT